MLPTFVIGLREGLEAALMVGIIAAFLVQENRRDALRPMWIGVAVAILISVGVGVGLHVADEQLPQRQQEGLETVIAAIAVVFVTMMIVWMRRNSRNLKGELQESAATALARNSATALVAMAFFSVIREGFETAFFLTAAFDQSDNPGSTGTGAVLGVLVAMVLGWLVYRGGARINLSKFFRATGVVLVFVAAGLVASALHTAHEADWLSVGQSQALDLSWLVVPGTVTASLLTGMLGLQPKVVHIELIAYLIYLVPMLMIVLWPAGKSPVRRLSRASASVSALLLLVLGLGACGSDDGGTTKSVPTAGAIKGAKTVDVQIADEGCLPETLKLDAGPTNFKVTAKGSGKSTEYEIVKGDRILGERENIAPGLNSTFSLDLAPGEYESVCLGADRERGKVIVTGSSTASAADGATELKAATVAYSTYVEGQTQVLLDRTKQFVAAIKAGDLAAAKKLYAKAREPYEAIEPVAESFGDLDPRIDARVNDVAKGDKWTGFHRIEQGLWKKGTTKGLDGFADQLLKDVQELVAKAEGLEYQPAELANGASGLLDEVSASKVSGEEDRYSHTDLYDFQANVDGARKAFDLLTPALNLRDKALATTIAARFNTVDQTLAKYKKGDGFVSYTELKQADVRALSQQVDALAEPLSKVAATVVAR